MGMTLCQNGYKVVNAETIYRTGGLACTEAELSGHEVSTSREQGLDRAVSHATKIDLSESSYFPNIYNQGNLGSCSAFASTYYQFSFEANRLNNKNSKNISNCYSPKWSYNYMNGGADEGSSLANIYELLKERGAVKWSEFPYNNDCFEWCNNESAMINALNTRISQWGFYNINGETQIIKNTSSSYLDSIKTALENQHPLAVSVITDGTMSNMSFGKANNGENIIYRCYDIGNSGHAMTIVGYDDTVYIDVNKNGRIEASEKGAFKVANSWGSSWGNSGYVWILYDALNKTSQISGDWEKSLSGNRISMFARDDTTYHRNNKFYFINVVNKKVDVISKFTFTSDRRHGIKITLNKKKSGYNYPYKTMISIMRQSAQKYSGTGTLIYDFSEYNNSTNEILGTCEWYNNITKNSIITNESLGIKNANYSLVDNNNNLIAKYYLSNFSFGTSRNMCITTNMALGSVDFDKTISLADAKLVQKYALGILTPSNLQQKLADYNQDGVVNLIDSKAVLNKALGVN